MTDEPSRAYGAPGWLFLSDAAVMVRQGVFKSVLGYKDDDDDGGDDGDDDDDDDADDGDHDDDDDFLICKPV